MNDDLKLPENCADMRDVRAGVDATDRELMELLDRRFGYMRAAARPQPHRANVRHEARKRPALHHTHRPPHARPLHA